MTEQLSCLDRAISCADSTIRHSTPPGRTWSRAAGAACCFEISNSRLGGIRRDARLAWTAPSPTATWPHKAHKQAGRETALISIHPYLRAKVTPSPPLPPTLHPAGAVTSIRDDETRFSSCLVDISNGVCSTDSAHKGSARPGCWVVRCGFTVAYYEWAAVRAASPWSQASSITFNQLQTGGSQSSRDRLVSQRCAK